MMTSIKERSDMKKLVVITGAGSGIGEATALLASQKGWTPVLLGRRLEKLQAVEVKCSIPAYSIPCDLSQSRDIEQALQKILAIPNSSLIGLVNNAGIFLRHGPTENGLEPWRKQFETNLFGHIQLTQGLIPIFQEQKQGSIVNVSSTLGLRPTAGVSAYSASKAAMNSWAQSLALELGKDHIRVNCVCPGLVDTPIHAFHDLKNDEKIKALENMKDLQPLGRIGNPEDIAKSIIFLLGEDSSWTTGAVLSVDGGINLT